MARQLLEAVRDRNQLDTSLLDDVIIGMAQPVGEQGGVLARAAVLQAGYAQPVGGQQIHRFCATGLDAVNLLADRKSVVSGKRVQVRVDLGVRRIIKKQKKKKK